MHTISYGGYSLKESLKGVSQGNLNIFGSKLSEKIISTACHTQNAPKT